MKRILLTIALIVLIPTLAMAQGFGGGFSGGSSFAGTESTTGSAGSLLSPASELTIASDAITVTGGAHTVDTQEDAASDDLVTINGGADGKVVFLRAAHTDRTVILKETGNIVLTHGTTLTLDSTGRWVMLYYDGNLSKWVCDALTDTLSFSEISIGAAKIDSTGYVTGLMPPKVLTIASGAHDGDANAATLTDSGESFTTSQFVGMTLYNITDGSSCTVTANNATTVTCTLAGGTDNDWDVDDVWQVGPGPQQSASWFYVVGASTIRHPATVGYIVCYESDAAAKLTVDMASDSMIFQGVLDTAVTALDAGDSIDSSGSTTGDYMCIHNKSATEAQGKGKRGTWADGGAS